jgi:hypothetical protein
MPEPDTPEAVTGEADSSTASRLPQEPSLSDIPDSVIQEVNEDSVPEGDLPEPEDAPTTATATLNQVVDKVSDLVNPQAREAGDTERDRVSNRRGSRSDD